MLDSNAGHSAAEQVTMERQEDFPFAVFEYLEQRLRPLRIEIMRRAARIAADAEPDERIYRVERDHIDRVLSDLRDDPAELGRVVGNWAEG